NASAGLAAASTWHSGINSRRSAAMSQPHDRPRQAPARANLSPASPKPINATPGARERATLSDIRLAFALVNVSVTYKFARRPTAGLAALDGKRLGGHRRQQHSRRNRTKCTVLSSRTSNAQ